MTNIQLLKYITLPLWFEVHSIVVSGLIPGIVLPAFLVSTKSTRKPCKCWLVQSLIRHDFLCALVLCTQVKIMFVVFLTGRCYKKLATTDHSLFRQTFELGIFISAAEKSILNLGKW